MVDDAIRGSNYAPPGGAGGDGGSPMNFYQIVAVLTIFAILYGVCYSCRKGSGSREDNRRQGRNDRYTVVLSTTYTNKQGSEVTDTQEMEFGSQDSANEYARRFLGQPGISVEIRGPIIIAQPNLRSRL